MTDDTDITTTLVSGAGGGYTPEDASVTEDAKMPGVPKRTATESTADSKAQEIFAAPPTLAGRI